MNAKTFRIANLAAALALCSGIAAAAPSTIATAVSDSARPATDTSRDSGRKGKQPGSSQDAGNGRSKGDNRTKHRACIGLSNRSELEHYFIQPRK